MISDCNSPLYLMSVHSLYSCGSLIYIMYIHGGRVGVCVGAHVVIVM